MPKVPKKPKARRVSRLDGEGANQLSDGTTTEATAKRGLRNSTKTHYGDDYPQFTESPKRTNRGEFGLRHSRKKTTKASVLETLYTETLPKETAAPAKSTEEEPLEEAAAPLETAGVTPPAESERLQQQDMGRVSIGADDAAKAEEGQLKGKQSTKFKSSSSEPSQQESKAAPMKPNRKMHQTRSLGSTNNNIEKEVSTEADEAPKAEEGRSKRDQLKGSVSEASQQEGKAASKKPKGGIQQTRSLGSTYDNKKDVSIEADEAEKTGKGRSKRERSTKFKSSSSEPSQLESEAAPTKPKGRMKQARSPGSTNNNTEKEVSTEAEKAGKGRSKRERSTKFKSSSSEPSQLESEAAPTKAKGRMKQARSPGSTNDNIEKEVSTEADEAAKAEEGQSKLDQLKGSVSEASQQERKPAPMKSDRKLHQTRSPGSANNTEKEPRTPAAFKATAKEPHDEQTDGAKPGRPSRLKAASLRSKKQPDTMTLETGNTDVLNILTPSDGVRELSLLTESGNLLQEMEQASPQASGNASTQTHEGRPKRERRTSTDGVEVISLINLEENEPARKRTRLTNRSTKEEKEASAVIDLTMKEHAGPSARAEAKAGKASSKSQPWKGKKPAFTLLSKSKKKRGQQTERKPTRSSVAEVTAQEPTINEAQGRKPTREADKPFSSKRNHAKRKSAPVDRRGLAPMEPAPPPPQIPDGLEGKWSYNEDTRLFLADFREVTNAQLPDRDVQFLLELMARDDLTVVSEGLWSAAFDKLVELEYLKVAFGNRVHHKFRMFFKKANGGYEEKPDGLTMRASDFFEYLEMKVAKGSDGEILFRFTDGDGTRHAINVDDVSIYMIDCDLPKILPLLYEKYLSHCKMCAILPGGEMCMMSAMNRDGRPFMGPNLYVATGGGFTSLHQDGAGTVDSGHSCIRGYNEVVMMRRMPEAHKHYAAEQLGYDGVHRLPHDIGTTYENVWPKKSVIEKWKTMNYYPSVFVLGPGQHLHINKSRLHTFRKVKAEPLDENDCHFELRNMLLDQGLSKQDELCISVAFDWMFLGNSKQAIYEEVGTSLHCADICREVGSSSLGIPETCLLGLAGLLSHDAGTIYSDLLHPIRHAACQGILPHLKDIVEREITSGSGISKKAKMPDSERNPDSYGIDPYGSDYFCFTCKRELANTYFHCLGCENLLQKDFNICRMCLDEKKYGNNMSMGFEGKTRNSDIIHAGVLEKKKNTKNCQCRQGICRECGYCKSCSCSCHHDFQLHYRFYTPDELKDMLKCVGEVAAKVNVEQIEISASELEEDHFELPGAAEQSTHNALTQLTDEVEKRDAEQIVHHDVLPTCASELMEDRSKFPGAVDQSNYNALSQEADRETNRAAGWSESRQAPCPDVKTNALEDTSKDPSTLTAGVSRLKACYTNVQFESA